jgi:hypothetical protein
MLEVQTPAKAKPSCNQPLLILQSVFDIRHSGKQSREEKLQQLKMRGTLRFGLSLFSIR